MPTSKKKQEFDEPILEAHFNGDLKWSKVVQEMLNTYDLESDDNDGDNVITPRGSGR